MKKPYETMVIIDGTLPDETVRDEQQRLEKFFRDNSELEKVADWGKRQLAYEIKKKRSGAYLLFLYRAEPGLPDKLDKSVKLNTNILRYMTLVRDPKKRTQMDMAREEAEAPASQPAPVAAEATETSEQQKSPEGGTTDA
jgi:small subunit ribosomal protein S6